MNRLKTKKGLLIVFVTLVVVVIMVTMNQKSENPTVTETPKKETSRIEYISTDFNQNTFTDGNELKLLKELKL